MKKLIIVILCLICSFSSYAKDKSLTVPFVLGDKEDPINNLNNMLYINFHHFGGTYDEGNSSEEIWRWGYTFSKEINGYSPTKDLRVELLYTSPDFFMYNMVNGAAIHFTDKDTDKSTHIYYLRPVKDGVDMEFGQELYYFQKHHAVQIPEKHPTGYVLNAYQLDTLNYVITLYTNKNTGIPSRIIFNGKSKGYEDFGIEYDDYRVDLTPDINIFRLPRNTNVFEATKKMQKQIEESQNELR